MQTSYLFGEHGVPSFTLLDIAKKKSKSSAVQYNLHLSSSKGKNQKQRTIRESISRSAAQFKQKSKAPRYCLFLHPRWQATRINFVWWHIRT